MLCMRDMSCASPALVLRGRDRGDIHRSVLFLATGILYAGKEEEVAWWRL